MTSINIYNAFLDDPDRLLAQALSDAGACPFAWNATTGQVVAALSFYELFEIPLGAEIDSDRILSRVHPDDRTWVAAHHAKTLQSAGSYENEFRIVRQDGSIRWILARGKTLVDDCGSPLGLSGILLDVTERKEKEFAKEAEIVAREGSFRTVQEASLDGFMLLRAIREVGGAITDFEWLYANSAAERIVARPAGWFVGRRLLAEMPGNVDEGLFAAYVAVVETGQPWTKEFTYRRDGVDVYLRAAASRSREGLAVTFADLTERRQVEAKIVESELRVRLREEQLARVQRIGEVGGVEVDLTMDPPHGSRSPEYLRIHGLPLDTVSDTHADWLARIIPEDRQRAMTRLQAAMDGRTDFYESEYRIVRPNDGQMRWILAKAEIRRDANGKPTGLVGAHIDISDLRRAEEQRELITQELFHRIKNIFAVVGSLITLSAGRDLQALHFAQTTRARIDALAEAHHYILPDPHRASPTARTVHGLLTALLVPYARTGAERIRVSGDDAAVGIRAATALSLIVHELATNAVKYGALTGEGCVSVVCSDAAGDFEIKWIETGGPTLKGAPTSGGFGTSMSDRVVRLQLGATLRREWQADGLAVTINVRRERLAE